MPQKTDYVLVREIPLRNEFNDTTRASCYIDALDYHLLLAMSLFATFWLSGENEDLIDFEFNSVALLLE